MKIRHALIAAVGVAGLLFSLNSYPALWPFSSKEDSSESDQPVAEVTWEDLIPEDFEPPENPYMTLRRWNITIHQKLENFCWCLTSVLAYTHPHLLPIKLFM